MNELKRYSKIADEILHNDTKYYVDKKIINNIFIVTQNSYNLQNIIFRLTIIDSYYSTQMNKRYFGIEDIAKSIFEITDNETKLQDLFIALTKEIDSEKILNLFHNSNYGIHKNGKNAGRAISLISKYAYYQTKYYFPIYDSLAKKMYPLIMKKYYPSTTLKGSMKNKNISDYIKSINQLNQLSGIANYDRLDNLLWLSGKISSGNFSLLFKKKEQYVNFAKVVISNTNESENDKKIGFSKRVQNFIRNDFKSLSKVIDDKNLLDFIKFTNDLNPIFE